MDQAEREEWQSLKDRLNFADELVENTVILFKPEGRVALPVMDEQKHEPILWLASAACALFIGMVACIVAGAIPGVFVFGVLAIIVLIVIAVIA